MTDETIHPWDEDPSEDSILRGPNLEQVLAELKAGLKISFEEIFERSSNLVKLLKREAENGRGLEVFEGNVTKGRTQYILIEGVPLEGAEGYSSVHLLYELYKQRLAGRNVRSFIRQDGRKEDFRPVDIKKFYA